ncbi:MAG TPA: YraN family protein [Candidatus Paceibacterota bacterium]|nr:YraN family protein [Candidatus Paceibacterota bacterium]HSA02114.1 YraN family protein [Candidatus Paceibacterota bacterium]
MKGWGKFGEIWRTVLRRDPEPLTLRHGRLGEAAARRFLRSRGWKLLAANYRTRRGEIDLVFREGADLVFVEVKTRSSEEWRRPAAAVRGPKRRRISRVALEYLRAIHCPAVKIRFDVVEVLLDDGQVAEIRHLPNAFPLSPPYRYG